MSRRFEQGTGDAEQMNIYEKMASVTQEMGQIPKNLVVGYGKNQYKAVAEGDVLSRVKQLERKHGIYSYPHDRRTVFADVVLPVKDGEDGRQKVFIRIETTYRFVNLDDPKEYIEVKSYGDGVDTLDKAPGKAMTYSDKYCLLKAYKIETGDDLDKNPSDSLAGHDITCIKRRVEQLITAKLAKGMSMDDLLAGLNINEKTFNALMGNYTKLAGFEAAIQRL